MSSNKYAACIFANFGGPRDLTEVAPFLRELLIDKEVLQTPFPQPLHTLLFSRIAKKRAVQVARDYASIGGSSPIYADTEAVAKLVQPHLDMPIITFHRYLPKTHRDFIQKIKQIPSGNILVFPFFPQFTYATSGSIAKWFSKKLPKQLHSRIFWIQSYAAASPYIDLFTHNIRSYLEEHAIDDEKTLLLFSAHGLPKRYVEMGDLYEKECQLSYQNIIANFPKQKTLLAYQSKFGRSEWLKPYTETVCREFTQCYPSIKRALFIPLSFTSDHIETLYEVETMYMSLLKQVGISPYRLPAFNRQAKWIEAIIAIIRSLPVSSNDILIRE